MDWFNRAVMNLAFPTHVGVNRREPRRAGRSGRLPHTRGGEPWVLEIGNAVRARLPHTRGGEPHVLTRLNFNC